MMKEEAKIMAEQEALALETFVREVLTGYNPIDRKKLKLERRSFTKDSSLVTEWRVIMDKEKE